MAGPLYARYVPPKPSANASKPQPETPRADPKTALLISNDSKKRKRKEAVSKPPEKKASKKRKVTRSSEGQNAGGSLGDGEEDGEERTNVGDLKTKRVVRAGSHSANDAHGAVAEISGAEAYEKRTKMGKRGREREGDQKPRVESTEGLPTGKHTSILSKYEKVTKQRLKKPLPVEESNHVSEGDKIEVHPLVPLPVPKRTAQGPAFSAQSALPPWLSDPISVSSIATASFKDLQVAKLHVDQLHKQGFEHALPVQSGVLPLLLPVPSQHPGDLCVSAATGSGKTLGYVLPMVQDLSKTTSKGLRAVIVVPTRELVNQVRATLDLFVNGTSLKIGVVTGAQHLEDEQIALVESGKRYDPAAFAQLQQQREKTAELDHVLDKIDEELGLDHEPSSRDDEMLPQDYVPEYSSKVDILVCTPGRLVDHIKRTAGFTLSKLEWLVIDEADRLLDASFQEWVETINAAMAIPKLVYQDPFLAGLFNTGWKKSVRKVVLSATMTRDLQKLAGLRLRNPRMVVIEGSERQSLGTDGVRHEGSDGLGLPPTLAEYGIPVGDGSEKPLYLLSLLDKLFSNKAGPGWPQSRRKLASKTPSRTLESGGLTGHSDGDFDDASMDSDESSILSESSEGYDRSLSSDVAEEDSGSEPEAESNSSTASNALVFTSSNDSAHRLAHLLQRLRPAWSSTLSTLTKSGTSRGTLKTISSFRSGILRLIIATERASRGLDLPNLDNVINYDIPHNTTSYVHRIGRTARAGKQGHAWTLVEDRQARWFWKDVAKGKDIDRGEKTVERVRMDVNGLGESERAEYKEALSALEQDVREGAR